MTYAGFTLYGPIDMGYGYGTAGVPFGDSCNSVVYYGVQRTGEAADDPGR